MFPKRPLGELIVNRNKIAYIEFGQIVTEERVHEVVAFANAMVKLDQTLPKGHLYSLFVCLII